MRYALLICDEDKRQAEMSEDEAGAQMAGYMAFGEEMGARGVLQGGERLQPAATATTVRVRDGEVLTSDGPFAETKEQLGRLLPGRVQGPRRGDRGGVEDPRRPARLDRGAPDLGDVVGPDRSGRGSSRPCVPGGVGTRRRHPDPDHGRLGPRRGVRAGCLRPGARAVAPRRRARQPGRLAHDDRAQPRARPAAARADRRREGRGRPPCLDARTIAPVADRRQRRRPTTGSGSSSRAATRRCRSRRRSRSRCARSPASPPPRSRARSSCRRRRWRSGWCGPSARSSDAGIPYRVPPAHLLPERTDAVLAVLYLLFNEGYVASSGAELRARRPLGGGHPARAHAHRADARRARGARAARAHAPPRRPARAARVDADGELVPLEDQDRTHAGTRR